MLPRWLLLAAGASALQPVKLIIDTDMSTDVDDVAALAIAHKLQDQGRTELLAVLHNTGLPGGVGAISVINHFYGRDDVPIGAYKGPFDNPDGADAEHDDFVRNKSAGPYVGKLLKQFHSPIRNNSQVPDAVDVYRAVLAQQHDHSVVIASIGFLGNLAALLASGPDKHSRLDGKSLVAKKVKTLAMMGGCYPSCTELKYEWNMGGGCLLGSASCPYTPSWTKAVVDGWPKDVPLMYSGAEMGAQVKTGGRLTTCAAPTNPVRVAYEAYKAFDAACPPRSSWDPLTVFYAVRGLGHHWTRHVGGHNTVNGSTGANHWVDGAETQQSYLVLQAGQAQMLAAELDELLCMPPGPQPGRPVQLFA